MSAKGCGTCTLCCTVMRVDMQPPKEAHETCTHCSRGGCSIYADRPDACRGFQCLWLASQQVARFALPAAMRPDRCGVAIDLNAAGTVIAHCASPASWRREPIRSWLVAHAGRTNVMLETPIGSELLAADGSTERLHKVGVHSSGNRLYVRESDLHRHNASSGAA